MIYDIIRLRFNKTKNYRYLTIKLIMNINLFEENQYQFIKYDKTPIVLIDISGSTYAKMDNKKKDSHRKIVLSEEIDQITKLLKSKDINEAYILFWDHETIIPEKQPVKVDDIKIYDVNPRGATFITQALNKIPESWFDSKKKDIYIVTDGEIHDSIDFSNYMKLNNKNDIHIFTVEHHEKDYLNDDCNAGICIYNTIQKNKLTNKVRNFIGYNPYYEDKYFTFFDNPDISDGYLSFRGKIFKKNKIVEFMKYIEEELKEKNVNEINKIAYDLLRPISDMIKGVKKIVKNEIILLFTKLFIGTEVHKNLFEFYNNEISNIRNGKAQTFQQYRNSRKKVFEKTQLSLFENVKKSITNCFNKEYQSFIISTDKGDKIYKIRDDQINSHTRIGNKLFINSSFKYGNFNIPIIPIKYNDYYDDNYNQCIRQWFRIIYSKKINEIVSSDTILYIILTDVLRVQLSNIDDNIKKSYLNIAKIFLNRKRYSSDIREYDWLIENRPSITNNYGDNMEEILNKCRKYAGLDDISNYSLWYAICYVLNNDKILSKQKEYCIHDIEKDNMNYDNIISIIGSKIRNINFSDFTDKNIKFSDENNVSDKGFDNSDYLDYNVCHISNKIIEGTYYEYPLCQITDNISHKSNLLISEKEYINIIENANDDFLYYPITHIKIKNDSMIKNTHLVKESEDIEYNHLNYNITEAIYDIRNHEYVEITKELYEKEDPNSKEHELKHIDDCNFNVSSYEIMAPTLMQSINNYEIIIKNQEDFNKYVYFKYPFLEKVDLKKYGAYIAGGFCRSILLKQKVKDLDFFITGDGYEEKFNGLLSNVLEEIKKHYEGESEIKLLYMYKPLHNVFEVIVVEDKNDFFKDTYNINNFDKYKYLSLKTYNKSVSYNPRNSYEENDSVKNYFEDEINNDIKIKHRLQFILTKNKDIENVMLNFDMYPSRVAWNGNTYFTKKSEMAFKYMINIINKNNSSELFSHRLNKYYSYGFGIVLPEFSFENKMYLQLGSNIFNVLNTIGNTIYTEVDSHMFDKLKSIEDLEKKSAEEGVSLYKSSLFASLVSILRYVCINKISYKFSKDIITPDINGFMKFRESEENITFIDKINTRIYEDLY